MDSYHLGLSVVPLRAEPSHRSEQVTELLFGEQYEILSEEGSWLKVRCLHDDYIGYMPLGQHTNIPATNTLLRLSPELYNWDLQATAELDNQVHHLPLGAELPLLQSSVFQLGSIVGKYNAARSPNTNVVPHPQSWQGLARQLLNTPYRWGGRSQWGIDCSGFTQLICRYRGFDLKRDAYLQALQGQAVAWENRSAGDLAYFSSTADTNKITHVGILATPDSIIHASDWVKINIISESGILSHDTSNPISHYFQALRRML